MEDDKDRRGKEYRKKRTDDSRLNEYKNRDKKRGVEEKSALICVGREGGVNSGSWHSGDSN